MRSPHASTGAPSPGSGGRRSRRRTSVLAVLGALLVIIATACVAEGAWAVTSVPDPSLPGASLPLSMDDVGCATADDCLAVGPNGAAAYDGSWATIATPPESLTDAQVACLPTGPCLVAGTGNQSGAGLWSWSGTAWSGNLLTGVLPAAPETVRVFCGSAVCVVVGGVTTAGTNQAFALRYDGSTFTDLGVPTAGQARAATAASCPTTSVCVVSTRFTDGTTEILRLDGSTWTTLTPARANGYLTDVSCPSAGSCVGISPETFCAKPVGCYTFPRLVTWRTGGAWTQYAPPGGSFPGPVFPELDCTAVDDCVLATFEPGGTPQLVAWNGTTTTQLAVVPEQIAGLDCVADGRCVAVSADPLRTVDGHQNASPQPLFLHLDDGAVRLDRSVSGPAGPANSRFTDVVCLSATSCIAVGWAHDRDRQRSLVGTFDGTAWRVTLAPTTDDVRLESIACTSPTSCVAVGGRYEYLQVASNVVRTFDGTTWTDVAGDFGGPGAYDRGLTEVACSNATRCVAAGDVITVSNWHGSWRLEPEQHGSYAPVSSACLPDGPCYAVFSERLHEWDGTNWFPVALPPIERDGETWDPLVQGVGCAAQGPNPTCLVALGAFGVLNTHLLAEGGPGGWTKTLPTAANAEDTVDELACSTSTQCVVIGGEGIPQDHVRNGGDWIPLPPRNLPDATSLSCVPNRCVHVGSIGGDRYNPADRLSARRPAAEVYDLQAPPS